MNLIHTEREAAIEATYIKVKKEVDEKAAAVKAPKFGEIFKGVKELNQYLAYKNYWHGEVNTLNKKTAQLLELGEKQGSRLIFRRGVVDHAFETGFRFDTIPKK